MFRCHYPPHYYIDDKIYFITARTVNKRHYFNNDYKKRLLKKTISEAGEKFNISFYAWVILGNHYHLLLDIPDGKLLPGAMKTINGKSSFLLNKPESIKKRKIWFNYRDRCVRGEKDFWVRFNYIHHNPIKHKYAIKMEEYGFSSYNDWFKKKGFEYLNDAFEKYPIIDFSDKEDV